MTGIITRATKTKAKKYFAIIDVLMTDNAGFNISKICKKIKGDDTYIRKRIYDLERNNLIIFVEGRERAVQKRVIITEKGRNFWRKFKLQQTINHRILV